MVNIGLDPIKVSFNYMNGTELDSLEFINKMRNLSSVDSFMQFTADFDVDVVNQLAHRMIVHTSEGGNAFITKNSSVSNSMEYNEVPDKEFCTNHLLSNIVKDSYGVEKTDFTEVIFYN